MISICNHFIPDSQSLNSTSFHRAVGSSSKPWNGYNCCVPGCYNSSGENTFRDESSKVSFHNLPDVKSKKGKTWIGLIHRDLNEDFVVTKSTKICSDHFLSTDFLLNCERRRLKPDAVPSCFLGENALNADHEHLKMHHKLYWRMKNLMRGWLVQRIAERK